MHKIPCTIEILTHNNAGTLERTLASVRDFDQIIVIDGSSTDGTREIAQRYGCEIIDQDSQFHKKLGAISDFAAIRNQGLAQARHAWFAFIDSDELFTPALVAEIRQLIARDTSPTAYWVPRKYVLDNTVIERACTYPNQQMRFFHRAAVQKFIKKVHERIEVVSGAPVERLHNEMLVPINTDRAARRRKIRYYVQIELALHTDMTVRQYLVFVARHVGVSLLYAWRTIRNRLVGSGARLPLQYELDYHVYNALLIKEFIKKIRL